MDINGKVIVITGASSGIGAATARALAAQGTTLVLAARRADELAKLQAEIEQYGGRALSVPTDVSQRAGIDQLVQTTLNTYGRIDVLINNAGVSPGKTITEFTDAELQRVFDVNLLAPARLISAVVPHMRRQGSGTIVNIGSVAGEIATNSVYAATKFGLRGLNDALRRELRRDNIMLVLIAPGFIRTAMTAGAQIPMPGPEIVAQAVVSAIRRPRRKIVVPWLYQPLVLICKLLPGLADVVLGSGFYQRSYRKRKLFAGGEDTTPTTRS